MTRRPILIGVTAIIALALTAGLAYGAGRVVGTQGRNSHTVGYQRTGTTSVVPASFSNHRSQSFQGSGYGSDFRSQMRGWMQDWMRDHSNYGSWTGTGYGRLGSGFGRTSTGQSSQRTSSGPTSGYWDDHYTTSHHGGSGSGGYGSSGYHHGDDGYDDCW